MENFDLMRAWGLLFSVSRSIAFASVFSMIDPSGSNPAYPTHPCDFRALVSNIMELCVVVVLLHLFLKSLLSFHKEMWGGSNLLILPIFRSGKIGNGLARPGSIKACIGRLIGSIIFWARPARPNVFGLDQDGTTFWAGSLGPDIFGLGMHGRCIGLKACSTMYLGWTYKAYKFWDMLT